MSKMEKRETILVGLDRDGTINYDVGYLGKEENWREQIQIYPDVAKGIRAIKRKGVKVIVATNQAGIARGFFDEERVRNVNHEIDKRLREKGVIIDAWYFCPYADELYAKEKGIPLTNPFVGNNKDRKPQIGMLERACKDLGINIENVEIYFIGDKKTDVETGLNAGGMGILVDNNGKYVKSVNEMKSKFRNRVFVVKTFSDACGVVLSHANL